jgi:anti-sigma regulatory factor (Ser/Thr protein kinase)
MHPRVGPRGRPARRALRGQRDQVACARDFVRAVLGSAPVVDEAVLLVSELCANALLHTASGDGGAFEAAFYLGSSSARIEVRDEGSAQAPAARRVGAYAQAGRGLGLVELLADRWGHSGDQEGRSVFFELRWKEPD